MLRVGVARIRGIHLHLRRVRGHTLRDPHVRTAGRLLYHHGSTHVGLRVHKLRSTWVGPHMTRLGATLVDVELWHGLPEC